jgi:hypothetical protein
MAAMRRSSASALFAWRAAAFVLATVWIAVPALSLAHRADSNHRFCAQHLTLEEGGGAAPASETGTTARPSDVEEEHESCSFIQAWRARPAAANDAIEARPLITVAPIAVEDRAPLPGIDLLALAPKTSPPVLIA